MRGGYSTAKLFKYQYDSEGININIRDYEYLDDSLEYYNIWCKELQRDLTDLEKKYLDDIIKNRDMLEEFIEALSELTNMSNYLIGEDKQLELKYPQFEVFANKMRSHYFKEQNKCNGLLEIIQHI